MYEPEWLIWWRNMKPQLKNFTMALYFPSWKANPTNWQIKKLHNYLNFNFIKTKL
jgi:hypothetical protein